VNAEASTRSAQQVLYSVSGLTVGRHVLTLTKESGTYMLVDRFDVS
jgi:alpha-L-fucosidase